MERTVPAFFLILAGVVAGFVGIFSGNDAILATAALFMIAAIVLAVTRSTYGWVTGLLLAVIGAYIAYTQL